MKLSQKQLRNLIEGILRETSEQDPDWLSKPDGTPGTTFPEDTEIAASLAEVFRQSLESFAFDPNDPSMASAGLAAWEAQKDAAVGKFENDVLNVVHECMESLINGEFYNDSPVKNGVMR
jgi:hypothetical protein